MRECLWEWVGLDRNGGRDGVDAVAIVRAGYGVLVVEVARRGWLLVASVLRLLGVWLLRFIVDYTRVLSLLIEVLRWLMLGRLEGILLSVVVVFHCGFGSEGVRLVTSTAGVV